MAVDKPIELRHSPRLHPLYSPVPMVYTEVCEVIFLYLRDRPPENPAASGLARCPLPWVFHFLAERSAPADTTETASSFPIDKTNFASVTATPAFSGTHPSKVIR